MTGKVTSGSVLNFGNVRMYGMTIDELQRAIEYRIVPASVNADGTTTPVRVYNLPEDTYQSFVGAVQKVTVADVQKAAARYIQADKMAVVIVGDLKAIEAGIKALNLGPIRVVPLEEFFK